MKGKRLEPAELVSGAGALALVGALYAPWYGAAGSTVTGWTGLNRLDAVLALLGLAALLAPTLSRRRQAVAAGQAALGALALAIVAWRLLSLPVIPVGPGGSFVAASGREWGALLALAGAAAVVGGAVPRLARGRARARGPFDTAEGMVPSAAGAAPAGPTVSQAGELRSARVESLRALAALSVLAYHSLLFSNQLHPADTGANQAILGGGYGVFFFFALSGYLLFWPFVKAGYGDGERISLRRYAVNRVLRIVPLYYVLITLLLLLHQADSEPGQWWRFALFAENFSRDTFFRADAPMWSLATEVHFYVLLPFVAALVALLARRSLARAAIVIAALGAATLLLRVLPIELPVLPTYLWKLQIVTLFFFFAAGMLLALLRRAWEQAPPRGLPEVLRRADVWILASLPLWALAIGDHDLESLVAPAAFLTIGAAVLPLRGGVTTRVLEWRALAIVGLASYSLYLWHAPLISWLGGGSIGFNGRAFTYDGATSEYPRMLVLALVTAVVVALASFRVIETPFLRLRRRWSAGPRAGSEAPVPAPQTPEREASPA